LSTDHEARERVCRLLATIDTWCDRQTGLTGHTTHVEEDGGLVVDLRQGGSGVLVRLAPPAATTDDAQYLQFVHQRIRRAVLDLHTVSDGELVETHTPRALLPGEQHLPRTVAYTVCYEDPDVSPHERREPNYGPFPTLDEALEFVPFTCRVPTLIVRLNADGTETVLYRWSWKSWRREH
jgi:hypothetical protein